MLNFFDLEADLLPFSVLIVGFVGLPLSSKLVLSGGLTNHIYVLDFIGLDSDGILSVGVDFGFILDNFQSYRLLGYEHRVVLVDSVGFGLREVDLW